MAENGRALKIDWNSVTLVGVRQKSYTMTNELVDVTTDDANGWRTLLSTPGLRSVDVTVSGITENQILLADLAAATGRTLTVQLPTTTGTLGGAFLIASYEESGEHDGAVEFTCEFQSSGVVTFTAGVAD